MDICYVSVGIYVGGRESQPASRLVIWQQLKFVFVDVQPIICPADIDAGSDNQSRVSTNGDVKQVWRYCANRLAAD